MGNTLHFPESKQQFNSEDDLITRKLALEEIMQLSCKDPKSFFTLMADCLSYYPVEMDKEVEVKLKKLKLIDDFGRSPAVVREIMQTIAENMNTTTTTTVLM